ncbi:MAG TPA: hypoxanthine-guanine phosphoribosyltransferase [Burkholderiales bacterium]
MLPPDEAKRILETAEPVCSAVAVSEAVQRVAAEIRAALSDRNPLVLSVMGGAVVFTGQLLPLLDFPLDFDYIHVSRYRERTRGTDIEWKVVPNSRVAGRVVLVIDDIRDEGETLAAIRERVLEQGAQAFFGAVFADKLIGRPKPIRADFVGISVPDRYVFGFGMDVHGAWRNLPAIYALRSEE